MSRRASRAALLVVALTATAPAVAWDPASGDFSPENPADLRVMAWNVHDDLCSTSNGKVEGSTDWCALARIVAALKPDVLILEECGDNDGNGTGSGVDSVATLTGVIDLFLHGGSDPFKGGAPVTAWVEKYAPNYDLPYVFVSDRTDGFNRNVILSRYPFADLNGDGSAAMGDIPPVQADAYAPGGQGGIRGFMFAEIDLPGSVYTGNLIVGGAHLKAGSTAADHNQRVSAAENVAYFIDYMLNGAGTGLPDPDGKIGDNPAVAHVLDPKTPVVLGGDWNEDELTNGQKGPAEWLTTAEFIATFDGTDRDRTDAVYDDALDPFSGSRATLGTKKYDYVAWQDSIAKLRRAFVFNSSTLPLPSIPEQLIGYTAGPAAASSAASDHLPVVADLVLPLRDKCRADFDEDGALSAADSVKFVEALHATDRRADFDLDGVVTAADLKVFLNLFAKGCDSP